MRPSVVFHTPDVATIAVEQTGEDAAHLCLVVGISNLSAIAESRTPVAVVRSPVTSTEVVAVGKPDAVTTGELVALLETVGVFCCGIAGNAVAVLDDSVSHPAREASAFTSRGTRDCTYIIYIGQVKDGSVEADADDTTGILACRLYSTLVTAVLDVDITAAIEAADDTGHSLVALEAAGVGDGQVLHLGTAGSTVDKANAFVAVRPLHLQVAQDVALSVELAREVPCSGTQSGEVGHLAHVDVLCHHSLDRSILTVGPYSQPVELLGIRNLVDTILESCKLGLNSIADGAEAPFAKLVWVLIAALCIGEGRITLGCTVTILVTTSIDDSLAEGIRMFVCSDELIPSNVLALVAVQYISQLSAGKPLGGIVFENCFADAVVLAVQVVCVDKLTGTDATTETVLAILPCYLTCVPGVFHLRTAIVAEPTAEHSAFVSCSDITRVVAILNLDGDATIVATDKGSCVGACSRDVALHTDVLDGQCTTAITATHEGCRAVAAVDVAACIEDEVLDSSIRADVEEAQLLCRAADGHVLDTETLTVERAVIAVGIVTDRDKGVVAQVEVLSQLGIGIGMTIVYIYHKPVVLILVADEVIAILQSEEVGLHLVAIGTEAPVVPLVVVASRLAERVAVRHISLCIACTIQSSDSIDNIRADG